MSSVEGAPAMLLDVGAGGWLFDDGSPLDDGVVEGALLIPLDEGDDGSPLEFGSPFDGGVVDGAPSIPLDDGDDGCPFEVGPSMDDGDSAPPLDDGTLLVGVDGAPTFELDGAELLLELIIPFGSLPLVEGAVTGCMFGGGGTLDGVTTPGDGTTTTGVGAEGAVGIDGEEGTESGEVMVGALTGDGADGGVIMLGVGTIGCVGILNDMLLESCNNRSNISISSNKFSSLYFLALV